jgi:transposase
VSGVTLTVKVAHLRLCHSRMMFTRAYLRESQEMVFDAHDRAFALFKGTCTRDVYDNMTTAVEAVFSGKERHCNRRLPYRCGATSLVSPSLARQRKRSRMTDLEPPVCLIWHPNCHLWFTAKKQP